MRSRIFQCFNFVTGLPWISFYYPPAKYANSGGYSNSNQYVMIFLVEKHVLISTSVIGLNPVSFIPSIRLHIIDIYAE